MGSWKARSTGDESLVVKEQAREKSIQQFLKASDGGQNKLVTAASHHYFCSSYNFFVIASACPINIAFSRKILLRFLSTIQKLWNSLSFHVFIRWPMTPWVAIRKRKLDLRPNLDLRPLDVTEIWSGSWTGNRNGFFEEAGELIFRGT